MPVSVDPKAYLGRWSRFANNEREPSTFTDRPCTCESTSLRRPGAVDAYNSHIRYVLPLFTTFREVVALDVDCLTLSEVRRCVRVFLREAARQTR